MSLHQLAPPSGLGTTDRVHLALAVGSALTGALTGTAWGGWMGLVVLLVVAARQVARRLVSVAAGGGVLATAQRTGLLDPAGEAGQAVARP